MQTTSQWQGRRLRRKRTQMSSSLSATVHHNPILVENCSKNLMPKSKRDALTLVRDSRPQSANLITSRYLQLAIQRQSPSSSKQLKINALTHANVRPAPRLDILKIKQQNLNLTFENTIFKRYSRLKAKKNQCEEPPMNPINPRFQAKLAELKQRKSINVQRKLYRNYISDSLRDFDQLSRWSIDHDD